MNNLIEERDERTRKRKKIKRKMDSIIGLSSGNLVDLDTGEILNSLKLSVGTTKMAGKTIRLLDEGYFDSGFVIKKGTLEKYLNGQNQYVRGYEMSDDGWQKTDVLNLTDDFVGTVNLGHMDFATFPFIVGDWTKKDLSLVDIENDRKGIDVAINLDEDSIFVKELQRQPFDIGISSEFYYHINEEDTEKLSEMLDMYMPVIDEVFIFAYGLVGECGNVNSSGLELKGATMNKPIEELGILENAEVEEEEKELGVEEIDITINEEEELEAEENEEEAEEVEEEEKEEKDEEAEAEADEKEESVEAPADEDVIENSVDDAEDEAEDEAEASDEEDEIEEDEEDDLDDEDDIEEADELTEALSLINELTSQVAELTNKLAEKDNMIVELKKSNRRKDKKLAMEKEAKAKFLAETKNVFVELFPNEAESDEASKNEEEAIKSDRDYIMTGGVADI